jgi:hypothetical protein
MSSEPIRDPAADHLLTPQNSAFIVPYLGRSLARGKRLSRL